MDTHSASLARRRQLRQEILRRRDGLTAQERQAKSRALAANLFSLSPFVQARSLLFFASFRSEVDTAYAMQEVLKRGGQVALPVTLTPDRELRIYQVRDLQSDLVCGYQGIPEPDTGRCAQLEPAALDLVIVPGSVFDRQGGRMGYGGGYYDRFLVNRAPQAVRVGICFDLQVVESVPMADHDQYVDYLVTESQIAECGRPR